VSVIWNGIRPERFASRYSRVYTRRLLGLPGDRPIAGMVARLSPEKGAEYFIDALAWLARRGSDVHGVVVGDGPERAVLEKKAGALGLRERITFAGQVDDVAPWLASFDVAVCPSLQESFGLAAVEAQAAGVPVVATRAGGFSEILSNGMNALLVEPADAEALARAIRRLLDDPGLVRCLVQNAKQNVASRFTLDRTASRYAALYRELMSEDAALKDRNIS
jgi:glycosyltransferase involved in cell wall biosynthesis